MAGLWDLGVRDVALDVVSAWKEVLLALALGAIVWRRRGIPFKSTSTDWLALAYTAFVLLYAVIPQDWLGGDATARGVLYGLRHDLTPVAAYFLGRGITLGHVDRRRLGCAHPRRRGRRRRLGARRHLRRLAADLARLRRARLVRRAARARLQPGPLRPAGELGLQPGDERPLRRLVSTFLSPLATAYLLLVAILLAATWQRSRWLSALTGLLAIGLLFTYSRTSIAALAVGLVALAYALRSWWPVAAAAVFLAASFFFVRAYPDIAPETRYTPAELKIQREGGQEEPTSGGPLDPGEASFDSHLDNLRDGIETVVTHPQGYGLGNAGVTAKRTEQRRSRPASRPTRSWASSSGSSGCWRSSPGTSPCCASSSAGLPGSALPSPPCSRSAIQTDVIGVHWLAFVLWTLAGERA